jgi:hypothetical protein
MNTLARSLDALLGPAMSRRARKRHITSVEDGDDGSKSRPEAGRKRRRLNTTDDDAGYDQNTTSDGSTVAIASSASTKSRMRIFARPIKQFKRRVVQQQPVKVLNFSRLGFCTLPPTINSLLSQIKQRAKGINTIPDALKTQILDQDPDLDSDDDVWQTDSPLLPENAHPRATLDRDSELRWSRTPSQTPGVPPRRSDSSLREAHNRQVDFPHVEMIVEQARECSDNDDSEAGWNSHVNGPLFLLACYLSRHQTQVKSVDLTSARPLARLGPDDKAADPGKMVDFGIYLQPSDKLRAAYNDLQLDSDDRLRSFNHMDAGQIAGKPLVISVEALRGEQRGFQADLKLSQWVASHLGRLADLRKRALKFGDRTVWLPLLKVVGPVWYLLLACGNFNDDGELFYTTVYSRHQLGDITTYHGFFQVLAVILELINWTETKYRPWFEDWVTSDQEVDETDTLDGSRAFEERSSALDGLSTKRISITSSGSYEIS